MHTFINYAPSVWDLRKHSGIIRNMSRLLTALCLTIFCCSCNYHAVNSSNKSTNPQTIDTTGYKGLNGTWIKHEKLGFTLIEIKDTANVLFYEFMDRETNTDSVGIKRYFYYKSKAKMGYWNGDTSLIWIATDNFRFDYKRKGDTLIEFDKMGDQGVFIKVYNDNE